LETFGVSKLEWLGYPMVKKVQRHVYSFWHNPRMWRHRPHLCIASRGKNVIWRNYT